MESSDHPQKLKWLAPALQWALITIAALAGVAGFVVYRGSKVLDPWVALADQVLPLQTWSLESNFSAATAAYLSLAWTIYPLSIVLTIRKSLYPPVGLLGLPYSPKHRVLLPLAALFFLALSVGGALAFRGQDTRYIKFGTDILQLVWLGWTYPLTGGVLAGMSAVILWKSISGR